MTIRFLHFVALLSIAFASTADAHAFLDHSQPAVGSKVHSSPAEVRLWFTEKLEAAFSKLRVFNEAGQEVDRRDPRLDPHDTAVMVIGVPSLKPGVYKVVWHAVSVDTHTTHGSFKFEVVP